MTPVPNPKRTEIAITGRCNLNCRYCFFADEMVAHTDLSTGAWLHFFDELAGLGVMEVGLTGGEPFTRPDFFEIVDGIIARRMRYSICSNGTLIDEAVIGQFKVGKRRLRLNTIQLSVDGSRAEIHDLSRPGSFNGTLRGLRLLSEAGFPTDVRVTINRHNLHDLDGIAELLLEDVGLPSFGTNEAFPMGMGCSNREEISLTPAEQFTAMKKLDELLQKYPGRIKASAGPLAKKQAFTEMEEARLTGVKTNRWGMGFLTACGCVFSRIDILQNGDIVPCHIMHRHVLGNVQRDSLGEVWQNHPALIAMRNRRTIPMQEVQGCGDCEWAPFCNGSCPGLAREEGIEFNAANFADCYHLFLKENGEEARQYFQNRTEGCAHAV